MKKQTILIYGAMLMGVSLCTLAPAEEWIPLFDGKTLDGWEATGQAEWSVEDGLLLGTQTTGQGGDLFTRQQWQDFELRFVYRVGWPANSGMWFRFDRQGNKGYQFDILKYQNPVAFSGSLYCPGKLFITRNLDESLENRDGWNEGTIRAQGQNLVLTLNGHEVGACRDDTLAQGCFGIQVHAGDGFKGMQIAFKKIELRPLPAATDTLDEAFVEALHNAADLILTDVWGKGTQAGDAIEKLATGPLNGVQRRALETMLLDIVERDGASQRARYVALRTLSLVGSEWCAAKLERVLLDAELSHMACQVLERLPGHAATQTLIKVLPRAEDAIKTGVMSSLGVRGEACAVPVLIPVLASANTDHVCAAASALGQIGSPLAVPALQTTVGQGSPRERAAALDACLHLAERLQAAGQGKEALQVYSWLGQQDISPAIENAVLRGIVENDFAGGARKLLNALDGDDLQSRTLAGRIASESLRPDMTEILTEALLDLSTAGQVVALHALAARGDASARTAVLPATRHPEEQVRIAALEALGSLGTAADVPTFLRNLAQGSELEKSAAMRQVELLADPRVNEALLDQLKGEETQDAADIILLLGRRHYTTGSHVIVILADSTRSPVRQAALDYLSRFGGDDQLAPLLVLLKESSASGDVKHIEKTLISIAGRTNQQGRVAAQLAVAMGGDRPSVQCSLIKILGTLGGRSALDVVQRHLEADNLSLREAALAALLAWPDALAIPDLLTLAREGEDGRQKILALRSLIRVIGIESPRAPAQTVSLYQQAWSLATRDEERRWILSGLSTVEDVTALQFVASHLADPAVKAEAEVAAVKLGLALLPSDKAEATNALRQVQQQTGNEDLVQQIRKALK